MRSDTQQRLLFERAASERLARVRDAAKKAGVRGSRRLASAIGFAIAVAATAAAVLAAVIYSGV